MICTNCSETYDLQNNPPIVGICGHSVCFNCFDQIQNKPPRMCPICSRVNAFYEVKFNHQLNELMSEKERQPVPAPNANQAAGPAQVLQQSQTGVQKQRRIVQEEPHRQSLPTVEGTKLRVNNLDENITLQSFTMLFQTYGRIKNINLVTDTKGTSKGYGVVIYLNVNDAIRAIAEMDNKLLGSKRISVKLADANESRQSTSANATLT